MVYTDSLLDELHDAIFGNGNEPTVNYDEQSINYNENGDTYYWINTYSNREVKSIMVCARIKDDDTNLSGYREIYVDNDDFYAAIDFITDHLDDINMSIDKQMEEKQRKLQLKWLFYGKVCRNEEWITLWNLKIVLVKSVEINLDKCIMKKKGAVWNVEI